MMKSKPTGRQFNIPISIALIISVALNIFLVINTKYSPINGVKIIAVIDGDTLVLEGKSLIRLRHVDAPELKFCGGKEAKNKLEELTAGKYGRVEEQIADQYGRGMALVYVGNILINEEILKSGWARYHHDISSQENKLKSASEQAKSDNLGIFGKCQTKENRDNPKCIIKGNIDKNSKNRKYYLPNCAQYKYTIVEKDIGEDWFCTEKEAQKAGFTKAETCR